MNNTITLAHGDEQVTLTHAITSGKARVAVAKVIEAQPGMNEKLKLITERILMYGGESASAEAIKSLLETGAVTIEDVMASNVETSQSVEQRNSMTYALFRIACDQSQLTSEWKQRINNDDYLGDQDVKEVEAFVATFRKSLGA